MSTVNAASGGSFTWARWLVPLAVMLCILAGTSWPRPPNMPGGSDKVIHFLAYGSFGAALGWAARARSFRTAFLWLALGASLLGAADEWHQKFIPSRSMDARDWMADTAGAVTGLFLVTALARRRESVA